MTAAVWQRQRIESSSMSVVVGVIVVVQIPLENLECNSSGYEPLLPYPRMMMLHGGTNLPARMFLSKVDRR